MKKIGRLLMSLALSACSAQDEARTGDVPVPVEQLASQDVRERGRVLYLDNCAHCHGVRGDGNGIRREGLSRKPANFTSKDWRARSDPQEVYRMVSEGKRGTSMPGWPTLREDEKWAVVAYVLSVAEQGP